MATGSSVAFTITAADLASPVMQKVAGNTRRLAGEAGALGAVFGRTDGARKFSNALENIAFQSVGVSGRMGTMLQGLASLSLGSPIMLGVTAGIAGLVGVYKLLSGGSDDAKKKIDDISKALDQQAEAARNASLAGQQMILDQQKAAANTFLDKNVPWYLRGNQSGIDTYLQMKGKLDEYRVLLERIATAQQNLNNVGSNIGRPAITIDGGPGRSSTGAYRAGPVYNQSGNYLDILRQMTPGNDPARSQGFRVQKPGAQALDAGGNIMPPKELLDRIGFQQFLDDMNTEIYSGIATSIGDAVSAGFAAAFSGEGIGGALAAFGKTLLGALGGLFNQLGDQWIAAGLVMLKLTPLLVNPLTSAAGAIAIGLALKALGGALGGLVGGRGAARTGNYGGALGGGYGGGSYGGSGAFNRQPGTIILNLNGAPYLDLRDPETRDKITALIGEVSNGTRQLQYGGSGVTRG